MPDLRGTYFYGDYVTSFIRSFEVSLGVAINHQDVTGNIGVSAYPSSFGEDARGELYLVNHGGSVYRLVPSP